MFYVMWESDLWNLDQMYIYILLKLWQGTKKIQG